MEGVALNGRRPRPIRPQQRRSLTGLVTWAIIVLVYSLAVDLVAPRPEALPEAPPEVQPESSPKAQPETVPKTQGEQKGAKQEGLESRIPEGKKPPEGESKPEEPKKEEPKQEEPKKEEPKKEEPIKEEPKKEEPKKEEPKKGDGGKSPKKHGKQREPKSEPKKDGKGGQPNKNKDGKTGEDGQRKTEKDVEKEGTSIESNITMNATIRPYDKNCPLPAIEQFPPPLISQDARKHGALIIHLALAVYTFIGLAIVCDDYFVSSLDRICEEIKLSPDVAGATFMAAGSSAPELATVIISVFLARDDIGISGVIGSAVFNILFVISICALYATSDCKLNWFPMCRDCFWYALSILVMLFTIWNEVISWFEALFMLLVYVGYCVSLHFNAQVERWANTLPLPCKSGSAEEASHLVTYRTLPEDPNHHQQLQQQQQQPPPPPPPQTFDNFGWDDPVPQPQETQQPQPVPQAAAPPPQPAAPTKPDYYKPKEHDISEDVNPLEMPPNATTYEKIRWGTVLPIHYLCRKTMPDCKTDRFRHWYPFTFVVSMIWISFYSYVMVWMITIIGSTLGIPDTVMGLTFVAAGVSVPDALSSLAVVKEGYGDMAVSNAVGSNVFDILVCLGLPWFLKTAIISPGSYVNVYSTGLPYSTLSLLSTVIFLLVTTHFNGWKLDKKYGVILMLWYAAFILFASLYEMNVFGSGGGPHCRTTSDW